jgi:type II secretory pathway component PulM
MEQGVNERLVILSNGAPQFNVLVHALCWVHAERALRHLQGKTSQQRHNIAVMQQQLWPYYQQLKTYAQAPIPERKQYLEQAFCHRDCDPRLVPPIFQSEALRWV